MPDYIATLRRLFQAELGDVTVHITRNIFDIGVTSIMLVRIHAALQKELEFEICLVDLFTAPTIDSLAALLANRGTSASQIATRTPLPFIHAQKARNK
ncbi:MAG: acyl carrier protein [Proteobacteria bacterium]|nr:acyl carrier protein [Pseudomonadota bacterium]